MERWNVIGLKINMLKKRALERIVRSFGNHRRIYMLELLADTPELSLSDIATSLKLNIQTDRYPLN